MGKKSKENFEAMLDAEGRGEITLTLEGTARSRLARTASGACFVLVELNGEGSSPQAARKSAAFGLTPAEIKVLDLIAQGLSDREIGRRLFVSRPTVRSHVGRILEKLGVSSRLQAAVFARGGS